MHGFGATTYTEANIERLENYINEMELEVARQKGNPRRGVIRTRF